MLITLLRKCFYFIYCVIFKVVKYKDRGRRAKLLGNPVYILDLYCVWLSNVAPFCENYAKIYFDAKHLEKRLNRGRGNCWGLLFKKLLFFQKKCPFWPIWNAALNF